MKSTVVSIQIVLDTMLRKSVSTKEILYLRFEMLIIY